MVNYHFYYWIDVGKSHCHDLGMVAENSSCGCVGDTLNFSCTVSGGASTVWQGSAFGNCRIILLHSHFASGSGVSGTCNHGSIVAQSESYSINYSTNTSYYTSHLRVTAAHDLNNTDIQCLLHINSQLTPIGSYNISIISGTMLLTIIIIVAIYFVLCNTWLLQNMCFRLQPVSTCLKWTTVTFHLHGLHLFHIVNLPLSLSMHLTVVNARL